eukprot:5085752-Pyramimonas_sp.AAC.2
MFGVSGTHLVRVVKHLPPADEVSGYTVAIRGHLVATQSVGRGVALGRAGARILDFGGCQRGGSGGAVAQEHPVQSGPLSARPAERHVITLGPMVTQP